MGRVEGDTTRCSAVSSSSTSGWPKEKPAPRCPVRPGGARLRRIRRFRRRLMGWSLPVRDHGIRDFVGGDAGVAGCSGYNRCASGGFSAPTHRRHGWPGAFRRARCIGGRCLHREVDAVSRGGAFEKKVALGHQRRVSSTTGSTARPCRQREASPVSSSSLGPPSGELPYGTVGAPLGIVTSLRHEVVADVERKGSVAARPIRSPPRTESRNRAGMPERQRLKATMPILSGGIPPRKASACSAADRERDRDPSLTRTPVSAGPAGADAADGAQRTDSRGVFGLDGVQGLARRRLSVKGTTYRAAGQRPRAWQRRRRPVRR